MFTEEFSCPFTTRELLREIYLLLFYSVNLKKNKLINLNAKKTNVRVD